VRLRQGRFEEVDRFGDDAVALARRFAAGGVEWLHVVDLDGARQGTWRNLDVIGAIASAVDVPIQAGGGARGIADIETALDRGVARVIVGTAAIESPSSIASWTGRFPDQLAVSLDTRGDAVAVRGWTAESGARLYPVGEALRAAGVRRFIHTEIRRDGTMRGVDLAGLRSLLPLGVPIIVAGGIASYADLAALRDAGAEGAIVGRALLDGTLDLLKALRVAAGPDVSSRPGGSRAAAS